MENGKIAAYRRAGVQSRLRARAEAADTPRERGSWTRAATLHELVVQRSLGPETVGGIAFLRWLCETDRLGGPHDGTPHRAEVAGDEMMPGTADLTSSSRKRAAERIQWGSPARCRKCGRFVAGRIPGLCRGCSAVHCPYCGVPDRCEHLLTTVADGEVGSPLAPNRGSPSPAPDDAGVFRRLLSAINYPVCAVVRDSNTRSGADEAETVYFAWDPAEVRRRLAGLHGAPSAARSGRCPTPPDTLLIRCGAEQHRISLPPRGPVVLLDHPDRASVEATLAGPNAVDGCLRVLASVRGRPSYNGWGWWMWLVHVAPSFGRDGSVIRDRLKEFDRRRRLRRLLRGVDLG